MAKAGITDWFSVDGRLSRLEYAIRTIVISVIFSIICALCFGSFIGVLFSTLHLKETPVEWQSDADDSPEAGLNISASASGWDNSGEAVGHVRIDTAQGKHKDVDYQLEPEPGAAVPIALTGMTSALIMVVAGLISFWIHLAAQIRRFHDIGQTGLFVLLNLIPGASFFIWVFLLIVKGEAAGNVYGPNPLESQSSSPPVS